MTPYEFLLQQELEKRRKVINEYFDHLLDNEYEDQYHGGLRVARKVVNELLA